MQCGTVRTDEAGPDSLGCLTMNIHTPALVEEPFDLREAERGPDSEQFGRLCLCKKI